MKPIQNYERYWQLTNAFTDYNGDKFLNTLRICVDFIDKNNTTEYSTEQYNLLQYQIHEVHPITYPSIRKAINQLVKMGFINPLLMSYHPLCHDYLNAQTNRKRGSLLSKIVYENAKFFASISNSFSLNPMNFLIKTLVEAGSLDSNLLPVIMLCDISKYPNGFVSIEDLHTMSKQMDVDGFISRKYNQISYFKNLLNKLDDIVFVNDHLYFTEDAKRLFGDLQQETSTRKRDPYLHLLYKNQLKEEVSNLTGKEQCMLESISYPVLIASHIKPFVQCTDVEAYDPNNGLLISRTLDSLFDLGYITFMDDGQIIFSSQLDVSVRQFWQSYTLDHKYLNSQRLGYLEYHHNTIFRSNCDYVQK